MSGTERFSVVVAGMHRSGTSGLTGCLETVGFNVPRNQIPKSPDNPKGFFESRPIVHLNDALLKAAGLTWKDWQPIPPAFFSTQAATALFDKGITLLEDEFGDAMPIALKDPRICRLFPYWREILRHKGIGLSVLHVHRHPMEVAQSLQKRNRCSLARGLLLWIVHVLQIERASRGCARAFCSFDNLLRRPVPTLMSAQDRLGCRFPHSPLQMEPKLREFLDPSQRHYRQDETDKLPVVIQTVYDILNAWVETGEQPGDYATLDRIHDMVYAVLSENIDAALLLEVLDWVGDPNMSDAALTEALGLRKKPELLMLAPVVLQVARKLDQKMVAADKVLTQVRNEVGMLNLELKENAQKLADVTRNKAQLTKNNAFLQKQLEDRCTAEEARAFRDRAESDKRLVKSLEQRLAQAEHANHALRNSTIWRTTAPLRRLVEAVSRTKRAD